VTDFSIDLRILLTEQCNLSCNFCHNEGQPARDALLAATPHEIGRIVADLREWREVRVKLSGGEPTLHPRLGEYVDAVVAGGATDVTVITNANRPDVLAKIVPAGRFRVSVNVPASVPVEYERMTRGSFASVVQSCSLLSEAGVAVALNSYWPPRRPPNQMRGLVRLAEQTNTTLKILCPCQVTDAGGQRRIVGPLAQWLVGSGFELVGREHHKQTFERRAQTVRLQFPWCPTACRQSRSERRSVRITATGLIHACLDRDTQYFGSIYTGDHERRRRFRRALDAVGGACSLTAMRVPIMRREKVPTDD
jgi:molybdenum cofactor biosynthesis enzyme MoaA